MPSNFSKSILCKPYNVDKIQQLFKLHVISTDISGPFDFITITLNPKIYSESPRNQLINTYDAITFLCNTIGLRHIGLAELTKKNNIHFHVLIQYKDNYTYSDFEIFCKENNKLFGTIYKSIPNKTKSLEEQLKDALAYITKDISKTYTYVKTSKMLIKKMSLLYEGNINKQIAELDKSEIVIPIKFE